MAICNQEQSRVLEQHRRIDIDQRLAGTQRLGGPLLSYCVYYY